MLDRVSSSKQLKFIEIDNRHLLHRHELRNGVEVIPIMPMHASSRKISDKIKKSKWYWRPLSLSELTLMLLNKELTYLGLEAYNYLYWEYFTAFWNFNGPVLTFNLIVFFVFSAFENFNGPVLTFIVRYPSKVI